MKSAFLIVALLGLASVGCFTTGSHTVYNGNAVSERTRLITTGDDAGLGLKKPDGTEFIVVGGTNSTGQKHGADLLGTVAGFDAAKQIFEAGEVTTRSLDKNSTKVATEGIKADRAAEAGRQATARKQIGADTERALAR